MQKKLVYLSCGSNLGDRLFFLNFAIKEIEKGIGDIIKRSSVYESEAWGFKAENFLNQCLLIETKYNALDLLLLLQEIEKKADRKEKQGEGYTSRELDIDILFFNDAVIKKSNLKIPHPLLQERKFVLLPLKEIADGFIHPVFKKSITVLFQECEKKDKTSIKKIEFN